MSVPLPGRRSLVLEAERIDPEDAGQYWYHIVPPPRGHGPGRQPDVSAC